MESSRRKVLAGLGAGTVLGGMSVAGVRSQRQAGDGSAAGQPTELTGFTAVADDAFVTVSGDGPNDPDQKFPFSGPVEFEGVIYDDGHWESTEILNLPNLAGLEQRIVEETNAFQADTQLSVAEPMTGTIAPSNHPPADTITMNANFSVDISTLLFDFTVDLEDATATTGESGAMVGSTERLYEPSNGTIQTELVANEFSIPEPSAGGLFGPIIEFITNTGGLALPADPGDSYARFDFAFDLDDPSVLVELFPVPPVVEDPPLDLDGDGRCEDIYGAGEVTIQDTTAMVSYLESDVVRNHPDAFGFSRFSEGEVNILDVAAHWRDHVYDEG